jgi:uncharacterized membrane protein YhaH (DUF805 family)
MFKQPFSFEGRIRRTEYCLSFLIYSFTSQIVLVLTAGSPVFILLLVPLIWFLWAQGAKRCHDLGNNGWFQLIPFYVFWLMFVDGQRGVNEYGSNPKEVDSNYNSNGNYGNNTRQSDPNGYNGGYDGGHNVGGQNSGSNKIDFSKTQSDEGSEYKKGDLYK